MSTSHPRRRKEHHLRPALALLFCSLTACAPVSEKTANAPQGTPVPPSADTEQEQKQGTSRKPHTARLVERARAGRAVEILDESGDIIETLVPERFSQVLSIPDIANNSTDMISHNVPGTDIVAASVEPETGRVLLAVRGFIYAEVSTDLVFLLEPKEHGDTPRTTSTYEPIYFDGPTHKDDSGAPRPHLDVAQVSFLEGGRLMIKTSDASGGSCELVFSTEKMPESCKWSGGESRRCPRGIDAQ